MTSREDLLDQYINSLNRGGSSRPATNDPELSELFETAEAVAHLRQPDWPEESFARGLAASLSTRLTPASNGRAVLSSDQPATETFPTNPWVGSSEPEPAQQGRFHRTLRVAGALTAFTVFALVLILVFREVDDDELPLGAAPERAPVTRIAFSAVSSGNPEIYLINADGTGQVQLTDHPAADTSPVWSPDGTRIAFISDRSGSAQIWVMDADGSSIQQVTDGTGAFATPQWSPDGTRMAALRSEEGTGSGPIPEIWVFDADGNNARSLTNGHGPANGFDWSPDGTQIAASIGLSGRGDRILIYDVETGDVHALNDSRAFQHWPVWSPDGTQIALAEAMQADVVTGEFAIVIADLTGNRSTEVSSSLSFATMHNWSPDGLYISVVAADKAGSAGVFIVPLDDPEAVRLVSGASQQNLFPVWSPDSTQIAFLRHDPITTASSGMSLVVVEADGGNLIELATNVDVTAPPSWRPAP
jgi:TolB protein